MRKVQDHQTQHPDLFKHLLNKNHTIVLSDLPQLDDLCASHYHLNETKFGVISLSQGLDTFQVDHIIPPILYQMVSCQFSPVTLNLIRHLICVIEN